MVVVMMVKMRVVNGTNQLTIDVVVRAASKIESGVHFYSLIISMMVMMAMMLMMISDNHGCLVSRLIQMC